MALTEPKTGVNGAPLTPVHVELSVKPLGSSEHRTNTFHAVQNLHLPQLRKRSYTTVRFPCATLNKARPAARLSVKTFMFSEYRCLKLEVPGVFSS